MSLKLNCDAGESFGSWKMGLDALIMPYVDMANFACGFHAGDPVIMDKSIKLALKHGVRIGAHPAYPDLLQRVAPLTPWPPSPISPAPLPTPWTGRWRRSWTPLTRRSAPGRPALPAVPCPPGRRHG